MTELRESVIWLIVVIFIMNLIVVGSHLRPFLLLIIRINMTISIIPMVMEVIVISEEVGRVWENTACQNE